MGSGGYVICELRSVMEQYPQFQQAFIDLEQEVITKCDADWKPRTCGYSAPRSDQYGRTTILPPLFDDHLGVQMATWRQRFTALGHQAIMNGTRAGNTIPEDFKVGLLGFALPNQIQHLSEIRLYVGDLKYSRIDIEELNQYKTPAVILEKGHLIDEETTLEMTGFIEGPLPENGPGGGFQQIYQRIVPLGAAYYRVIDRILGNTGAVI